MSKAKNYFIGLDVGGTKVEAIILREVYSETANTLAVSKRYFEEVDRKRIPTKRNKGYEFVINSIADLIKELIVSNGAILEEIEAIGIGLPGSITPSTNKMINGNSQIFIDQDVIGDLKSILNFNKEIYVDNDANLFALAETFWGAGLEHAKKHQINTDKLIGVGIILGTGCGGGVIIEGKQLRGRNGGGAEIGHSTLINHGLDCYCKRKGCAEQYLSGTGLEAMYKRENNGKEKSGVDIFKDPTLPENKKVIESYQKYLGLFLTNLTNIFDPDFIVLGGGVSNQDALYENAQKQIEEFSFIPNSPTKLYKNRLGDSAGVLGAALLPIVSK